jgi:hypothetical protein
MAEMYSTPAPTTPDGGDDDSGMEVDNPTGDEQTALLPTDFFQGKELTPGSICKVQISRVLDGQVEVTYVPHSEEEEVGEESPVEGGDAEMAEYMGG